LPNASLTETTSAFANCVPTVAVWSLPETIAIDAGAAGTFVSANDAGASHVAIAVTA
jgi:ADP-heptose:LPS heptosyltransferase